MTKLIDAAPALAWLLSMILCGALPAVLVLGALTVSGGGAQKDKKHDV